MELSYKQKLHKITTFMFDVDGVLTNGNLTIMPDGELIRTMNVKDGFALKVAIDMGYKVVVISGGTNEGVKKRLLALGVHDVFLGSHHKLEPFNQIKSKYNLQNDEVLYMGDDLPDLGIMKQIELACCPQDAVPEIKQISHYISNKNGGEGCVRDVIEQVLKVQNKWQNETTNKLD